MSASIVKPDGTVKIPADVRRKAGVKAGQRMRAIPKGNTIVLVPAISIQDVRGIARGAEPSGYRERAG